MIKGNYDDHNRKRIWQRGLWAGEALAKHYGIQLFNFEALLDFAQDRGDFDEVPSLLLEELVNSLIYAIGMRKFIEARGKLGVGMIGELIMDCIEKKNIVTI